MTTKSIFEEIVMFVVLGQTAAIEIYSSTGCLEDVV
jgi:hypothetical protein